MKENKVDTKSSKMSEWILSVNFSDIPENVIALAKEQLLGMLGSNFAGSKTNGGTAIHETVKEWGEREEATILPFGTKTSVLNALYVNSALPMALDYDDYLVTIHPGVSTYSVPLAFGEKFNIDGKEYLTNMIIGNEIEGRVGLSVYPPGEGQMQTFIHAAGAVAMGGRILGLSLEQMINAFGIALYQVPLSIPRGFFGPQSKLLSSSIPAKTGAEAVFLAKKGLTGAADIFENPQGFCKYMSETLLTKVLDNDLGKAWLTNTISFKIYPGCAYVDAIADVMLEILAKYREKHDSELDANEIDQILVQNSLLSSMMDDMSRPFTSVEELKQVKSPVAVNFNQPLSCALILKHKKLVADILTLEEITDPFIHELAKKVKIKTDLKFSAMSAQVVPYKDLDRDNFKFSDWKLQEWKMFCGCKVKVRMKDGRRFSAKTKIPIGAAGGKKYPMSKKFTREAKYVGMKDQQIQNILEAVKNLE
ncbi:MAG: MmgE/PrpD family protein, partial [Candidatus Helarchaeota archaeon]